MMVFGPHFRLVGLKQIKANLPTEVNIACVTWSVSMQNYRPATFYTEFWSKITRYNVVMFHHLFTNVPFGFWGKGWLIKDRITFEEPDVTDVYVFNVPVSIIGLTSDFPISLLQTLTKYHIAFLDFHILKWCLNRFCCCLFVFPLIIENVPT